jgi:hypothetical protein
MTKPLLYVARQKDSRGKWVYMAAESAALAHKWGLITPAWEFVGYMAWDDIPA